MRLSPGVRPHSACLDETDRLGIHVTKNGKYDVLTQPLTGKQVLAGLLPFLFPGAFTIGTIAIPGGKEFVQALGSPVVYVLVVVCLYYLGRFIGDRMWHVDAPSGDGDS